VLADLVANHPTRRAADQRAADVAGDHLICLSDETAAAMAQ
jgi:hypothetical protein